MDFNELALKRQSCRDFNDKPLEKEVIDEILKMARLTPSSCNSQPWKIYVAYSNESIEKVKDACMGDGHNLFLEKAKAFLVIAEKTQELKEFVRRKFGNEHFKKYDIGSMYSYITLASTSLGVDSCIIGWINHDKLRQAVGLEDNEECNVLVALGYSDIPVREKKRKEIEEIVKYV